MRRPCPGAADIFSDCAEPDLALRLVFHQPLRQTAAIRAGALAPMPDGRLPPVLIACAGRRHRLATSQNETRARRPAARIARSSVCRMLNGTGRETNPLRAIR
jgi:hypothetical protein